MPLARRARPPREKAERPAGADRTQGKGRRGAGERRDREPGKPEEERKRGRPRAEERTGQPDASREQRPVQAEAEGSEPAKDAQTQD